MKRVKKTILEINTKADILKKLKEVGSKPLTVTSHSYEKYGAITIAKAAKKSLSSIGRKGTEKPAIGIIEVILSANRDYNKVVLPNLKRIEKLHPNLKSVKQLENLLKRTSKEDFFELWGHRDNKKYETLCEIIKAINAMRKSKSESDYDTIHKWAINVDLYNLKSDPIGKIKNVAIATTQHLRMVFGVETVKPDQRVKEVLENEFGLEKISDIQAIVAVQDIARISNKSEFEVDQILVKYGSGYYSKYTKQLSVKDIAKNLRELQVDIDIIAKATRLSKKQIINL
ncbi:hypothetical protein ACFOEE_09140 [Pseudoalteromonas fenneropenaei]|uniref:Uncharacterized protein n=1 Tax=Pseudoalteromonas fenneropenaei TaxID=1737459 RepID=A0ABV7CJ77_9GAMM